MKKLFKSLLVLSLILSLVGCGSKTGDTTVSSSKVFKIGICNYVDDASLNQIIANIKEELNNLENSEIKFEVEEQNCNADAAVLEQIISNFINDGVDLMIGVATPVAIAMQTATADNQIPVVFAAVSDPVGCDLVFSLENPGSNITGTSDYLNTNSLMDIILAVDPNIDTVGLLYDKGQDSSTTAIKEAKSYLDNKGIKYLEYNPTNTSEVQLVVPSIVADGITSVFTPSDNTIMTAELAIYEDLAKAGVKHFAGADSFALNGAFVGYGVDYAKLGKETAKSVYDVLINNNGDCSKVPVKTFDNGIVTVNTEVCEQLNLNLDDVKTAVKDLATSIKEIQTAESFD